jgi:tetratricopeptide (TPR) repeat protein
MSFLNPTEEENVLIHNGWILHQSGDLMNAESIYRKILHSNENNFNALHLLGTIKLCQKEYFEAKKLLMKAEQVFSENPNTLNNLGLALQELGEYDLALSKYNSAIKINAQFSEAFNNRGLLNLQLGNFEDAISNFLQAIRWNSSFPDPHNNIGLVFFKQKNYHEAIIKFKEAIHLKKDYAFAHNNCGLALHEYGESVQGLKFINQAILLKYDFPEAHNNAGMCLHSLYKFQEAIECYQKAIALKPNYSEAYANQGIALMYLRQLHSANKSFDRAISIDPENSVYKFNKSLNLLLNEEFDEGFKLYEFRYGKDLLERSHNFLSIPEWKGIEPLKNKKILLHAEQGFGDTIQFCRYAKLVSSLGAEVTLAVPKALLNLLDHLQGVSNLVDIESNIPTCDYHCSLASLPYFFKTNIESIPSKDQYIFPSNAKIVRWSKLLGNKSQLRVGIAWSGNSKHKNDSNRSIPLVELLANLPVGFQYISLQKEVRHSDQIILESNPNVLSFADQIDDFSDTAALIECMDLVVSVDTSIAHLSGAIAKQAFVMLPHISDWRWLHDRADSPWYESLLLLRQNDFNDWSSVYSQIHYKLQALRKNNTL